MRKLLIVLVILAAPRLFAQAKSGDGETHFDTGLTHLREGRLELAVEEFKAAIKEDPKSPYFYKGLGIAYQQIADKCPDAGCRQEPLKQAIAASRKALELNPYYTDARNDLGTALLRSGDREAGKKELITAFGDPTNPSPELTARNLGNAYLEDKNYTEALSWYQSAVNRNKTYADAWIGLGDVLVAQGRLEEAIGQLERGSKELPKDMNVLQALGEVYYRAGRFGEARTRLETVASTDPTGPAGRRAADLLKNFPN